MALRTYLLKGGFVWVDDFWGGYAWDDWVAEIGRVLPPDEYPIRGPPARPPDLPGAVRGQGVPADPVDPVVARPAAATSERGCDSAEPHVRGDLRSRTAT